MAEQPSLDEQTELKKRAIRRVMIAAILVAAAIAALTVLTRYKPETPVETAPSPEISSEQPVEPAAPPEEMAAPPTTLPEQEAAPQAVTPPPPPEVVNAAPSAAPIEPPKATKPMPVRPGAEAEVSARPAPAKPAERPVQQTPPKEMPAPAKAAAPVEKMPPAPVKPVEAASKGYTVQLGVFSNPANALQLQEKLARNGIKSHTETKLNVGPFLNKAEAEQALSKIRAMGVSAVMVPVR